MYAAFSANSFKISHPDLDWKRIDHFLVNSNVFSTSSHVSVHFTNTIFNKLNFK